jgi:hypothetical protein
VPQRDKYYYFSCQFCDVAKVAIILKEHLAKFDHKINMKMKKI